MRVCPLLACWVLTLSAGTVPASAQDAAFGVTIGYPGSVGVQWQPASRLAVRPAVTFRTSGSDVDEDVGNIESSSLSTSISGLVYLRPAAPFRIYLSPRYSFNRTRSTISFEVPQIQFPLGTITTTTITTKRTTHEHGVAGLIGAEYRLGERFGVFGEVGVLYTRASLSSEADNWAVGSTSGVGVNLYF